MNKEPQNGKGSKSRVTKKYQENYNNINWREIKKDKNENSKIN